MRITGLYRPVDTSAPYWQLDELNGRGIVTDHYTTYGPLLADASVVTGDRVSAGPVGWLASAGFSGMTTGRIEALRTAMAEGVEALPSAPALHGSATVTSELPPRWTGSSGPCSSPVPPCSSSPSSSPSSRQRHCSWWPAC